jgi:hypothetical protein
VTHRSSARRVQAVYALAVLALLIGTCVVTDLLAQNRSLERWLTETESALVEGNGKVFSYDGNFIDFEDRLMLDEIPRTDYSNGGVYFFGTSNMKLAFQTWDLPKNEKRLVHNYGIGAADHSIQLRFIKYLITYHRFLTAGDRDLVVFGAAFQNAVGDAYLHDYFLVELGRWGLFTITKDGAIAPTPTSPIARWLQIEKARSTGFIWNLGRFARNWTLTKLGLGRSPPRDPHSYPRFWWDVAGPQWWPNIEAQLESLKEAIELARSRHADVMVMLLPQASWMDGLLFRSLYDEEVRALCQRTSTPLTDFSQAIPDKEFVDSSHWGAEGQRQFRDLIMPEILAHLRRIEPQEEGGNPPPRAAYR